MRRVSYGFALALFSCCVSQLACDSAGSRQVPLDPAPARFKVKFETTQGDFVVEVERAWSPYGADRFYELVNNGYYNDSAFFRVLRGDLVQFGISGEPAVAQQWRDRTIPDDPVTESNVRGMVSFAKPEPPHSRTTQLFINSSDNPELDFQGFSPLGRVVEGMDVVDSINGEYRAEPSQDRIEQEGNEYLRRAFPNLDYIKKATVVED